MAKRRKLTDGETVRMNLLADNCNALVSGITGHPHIEHPVGIIAGGGADGTQGAPVVAIAELLTARSLMRTAGHRGVAKALKPAQGSLLIVVIAAGGITVVHAELPQQPAAEQG